MFNLIVLVLKFAFLVLLYIFLLLVIRAIYKDDFKIQKKMTSASLNSGAKQAKVSHPRLVIIASPGEQIGTTFDLEDSLTIGRAQESDIVLNDTFASEVHARILKQNGDYLLDDLGSTNGTFVKEKRITRPAMLKLGTRIRIGKTVLEYVE